MISTHAPRAGSDVADAAPRLPVAISTHAPRAGSDWRGGCDVQQKAGISTHAPRAGSDPAGHKFRCILPNFNPRSPCGERPFFWIMS